MKETTKQNLWKVLDELNISLHDIYKITEAIDISTECVVYVTKNSITNKGNWVVINNGPFDEVVASVFRELVEDANLVIALLLYKIEGEEYLYKVPTDGLNACVRDLQSGVQEL